jgi:hypothetical protein
MGLYNDRPWHERAVPASNSVSRRVASGEACDHQDAADELDEGRNISQEVWQAAARHIVATKPEMFMSLPQPLMTKVQPNRTRASSSSKSCHHCGLQLAPLLGD